MRCGGSSGLTPRWCGGKPETLERRKAPLPQQQIRERAATRLKTVGAILEYFRQDGGYYVGSNGDAGALHAKREEHREASAWHGSGLAALLPTERHRRGDRPVGGARRGGPGDAGLGGRNVSGDARMGPGDAAASPGEGAVHGGGDVPPRGQPQPRSAAPHPCRDRKRDAGRRRALALGHSPGRHSLGEIRDAVAWMVRDGPLVEAEQRGSDRSYVTDRTLKAERSVIAAMKAGLGAGESLAGADEVTAHLAGTGLPTGQDRRPLARAGAGAQAYDGRGGGAGQPDGAHRLGTDGEQGGLPGSRRWLSDRRRSGRPETVRAGRRIG